MPLRIPEFSRTLRNHPRVYKVWKRVRHRILSLAPEPRLAASLRVSDLPHLLPTVRCTRPAPDVEGWLSEDEGAALYLLARHSESVLEIGAWCGKSTIYLARGVLASGRCAKLTSCELAPTPANFRRTGPGVLGFFYPADASIALSDAKDDEYRETIHPVISRPGGLPAQLERNLTAAGCRGAVEFYFGDFKELPPRPYALIFCDAMHTDAEIHRNAPLLRPFLRSGAILACHDMTTERIATLKGYFAFNDQAQVDSLFVGRLAT